MQTHKEEEKIASRLHGIPLVWVLFCSGKSVCFSVIFYFPLCLVCSNFWYLCARKDPKCMEKTTLPCKTWLNYFIALRSVSFEGEVVAVFGTGILRNSRSVHLHPVCTFCLRGRCESVSAFEVSQFYCCCYSVLHLLKFWWHIRNVYRSSYFKHAV